MLEEHPARLRGNAVLIAPGVEGMVVSYRTRVEAGAGVGAGVAVGTGVAVGAGVAVGVGVGVGATVVLRIVTVTAESGNALVFPASSALRALMTCCPSDFSFEFQTNE
jgi:hypothetical protein